MSAHISLHLESSENKLLELDFSIFQKRVFTVEPLRKVNFFALLGHNFFSRFLLLSIYKKNSESIRPFVEKIRHELRTLS